MKEKKKFKIKNIFKSRVLFFMLGALIFGTIGVGATTFLYSSDVTYDNSSSGMSATTVQDALDELYEKAHGGTKVICDDDNNCTVECADDGTLTTTGTGYTCNSIKTVACPNDLHYFRTETGYKCTTEIQLNSNNVKLGEYVQMTPTSTSYSTNPSYVGGSSYVTTINPSELNLWRILKINEDGTIDLVSAYVSSTLVTFYGRSVGYAKSIGQLNLAAAEYANSKYTIKTRYFGYSSQIEFCSDAYKRDNCPSDTGYETDKNQMATANIPLSAYSVLDKATAAEYWVASRDFYDGTHVYVRYVMTGGGISRKELYNGYSDPPDDVDSASLRPIVTLKAELTVTKGSGILEDPYILE